MKYVVSRESYVGGLTRHHKPEVWCTQTVRETGRDLQSPYPDSKGIMSQ
jgi:hypothetical protein